MPDAVIVATARTPIGRARKGSLVGVDAFRLAQIAVSGVIERAGIDAGDIDDLVVAESLQGGGVIARNTAVVPRPRQRARAADNRHCAAGLSAVEIAAGSVRAGMGRRCRRRHREPQHVAAAMKRLTPPGGDPAPWMSPSHPETPDAPAFDMSITVGENTSREMGLTRATSTSGRCSARNALRSIDEGGSRRRSCRCPSWAPTARSASSRSTSTRVGERPSTRWHAARAAPGDRGRHHHRRQCRGPQRRGRSGRDHVRRVRVGARAHAARPHPIVGGDRPRARAVPGSDRRWRSRRRSTAPGSRCPTSSCGRSTRRSARCRSRRSASSASRRTS